MIFNIFLEKIEYSVCVFFGVILWPNVTITNSHIYFGKDAFIRLTTTRCQGMACIAWALELQKRFV